MFRPVTLIRLPSGRTRLPKEESQNVPFAALITSLRIAFFHCPMTFYSTKQRSHASSRHHSQISPRSHYAHSTGAQTERIATHTNCTDTNTSNEKGEQPVCVNSSIRQFCRPCHFPSVLHFKIHIT
jgi:hypothetical protein